MKISINREHCIGSGMCMGTAPEVFDLDEQSKPYLLRSDLDNVPDAVEAAVAACPVEALTLHRTG